MASPYKMKNSMLKMAVKGAPMQMNYAGSPIAKKDETDQEELTRLREKREHLRNKEKKRDDRRKGGKKVLFGNLKTKRNTKKQKKNQTEINANPVAIKNYKEGKKKEALKEINDSIKKRIEERKAKPDKTNQNRNYLDRLYKG